MRNSFINTMIECARKDDKVALLMAEVGFSVVEPFEKEFPERFYNTGIAEQNLVLTSVGMAAAGMKPVAYSMSAFLASRAFEQIKVSICYQNLPVILLSNGTGLSYGEMGSTHHAIEESAIMRSLPNLTVEFPSDGAELRDVLNYAFSVQKPFYISFPKMPDSKLMKHKYENGKIVEYINGHDGTILATGYNVKDALDASEKLNEMGYDIGVYGIHTVKPLDVDAIIKAGRTENIFVLDEHQQCCGIGGEIARIFLEHGVSLKTYKEFSIPDTFVDKVARYPELLDLYHLSAERIAADIAIVLKKQEGERTDESRNTCRRTGNKDQ